MSINNKDFFDDDFEVIYEEDLSDLQFKEEDDDYQDALSSLSELDNDGVDDDFSDRRRNSDKEKRKKKKHGVPNLVSPAAKTAKAGGKAIYKIGSFLLRAATLILIAIITYTLGLSFWKNHSAYGNILHAVNEKNYILGAYAGVALFLLLFEIITFLLVLFGSKNGVRRGNPADKGRGLFSFLFIYTGSLLSSLFGGLIPASPAPLQGMQGALAVYGSLHSVLFTLCLAGVVSCLIRRFIIR
ncbi:MAG: hypothetical protein Q4C52_00825 [Eubacteriales bacterium]|nr:hypothetical protein [Eubacteriales bacterium]